MPGAVRVHKQHLLRLGGELGESKPFRAGAYTAVGMEGSEGFGLHPEAVESHSVWELRSTGSVCRGTGILEEAGARQGDSWGWVAMRVSTVPRVGCGGRGAATWCQPPASTPGVLVGEAGPVGARVSRLGLLAQGRPEPAGCPDYATHGRGET